MVNLTPILQLAFEAGACAGVAYVLIRHVRCTKCQGEPLVKSAKERVMKAGDKPETAAMVQPVYLPPKVNGNILLLTHGNKHPGTLTIEATNQLSKRGAFATNQKPNCGQFKRTIHLLRGINTARTIKRQFRIITIQLCNSLNEVLPDLTCCRELYKASRIAARHIAAEEGINLQQALQLLLHTEYIDA